MSAEILHNGDLKIEEYNFADFLLAFQKAVLEGFYLDLDSNEYYPQKFGDHLYVILKGNGEVVTNDDSEPNVEVVFKILEIPVTQPRKTRKAKEQSTDTE